MNYLKNFSHLFSLENPYLFEKSLLNCHVQGVHSFILDAYGDYLTRMFVTSGDHLLWKNHCGMMTKEWSPLSVAIHPNHVDIEIYPIFGLLWNVEFKVKKNKGENPNDCLLDAFKWKSEILSGKGGFKWCGEKTLQLQEHRSMMWRRKYSMRADDLHTVYVTRGQTSAWIIVEKVATRKYDGICYSNVDLTQWTPDGLYQKPTKDQIVEIFKEIEIGLD
jgi:hypothetical protein